MIPEDVNKIKYFEFVNVCGKLGLFTSLRIDASSIPEGIYKYSIRHGDSGDPVTIEPKVLVNHYGDVLLCEELHFKDLTDKYIKITPKRNQFNFCADGFGKLPKTASFKSYVDFMKKSGKLNVGDESK